MFFLSFSFSTQNTLNWPKIQNGLLLQNIKIVKRGNFVTGIKIFTGNNLIISIVFIWYLPVVNLLSFLPVLMHSGSFFWKWCKFCYSVLYGTNVMYLTSQNRFLEDLRFHKLIIFLPPHNHSEGKITILKIGVPKRISW